MGKKWVSVLNSGLLIILSVVVTILATSMYSKTLYDSFQSEITSALAQMADEKASSITNATNAKLNIIQNLALLIGQQGLTDQIEIMENMSSIVKDNEFKRMGVIAPTGMCYTSDLYWVSLNDRSYFQKSIRGESTVSDCFIDRIGEPEQVNVYSAPIIQDENIIGVLYGTCDTTSLQKTLETANFSGRGYSYIVKPNGNVLFFPDVPEANKDMTNIFSYINETASKNYEPNKTLQHQLATGNKGYVSISENNVEKYLYYSPLGLNDWYLLTIVPTSLVNEKLTSVIQWYFLYGGVIFLTVLVLALWIQYMQSRYRKKLETLAYVDPLTQSMTVSKFKMDAVNIIRASDEYEYAIISLDVDKFKFINDLFGFSEGNAIIQIISDVLNKNLSEGELCAHKDADNFLLLLRMHNQATFSKRLERMTTEIKELCSNREKHVGIVFSIGIYQIEDPTIDIDKAIDNTQIPRKSIKGLHNVQFSYYDEALKRRLLSENDMENNMSLALQKDEFVVFYQPKYHASTSKLAGAEALVRWKSRDGSYIQPGNFIPLFESNGFIVDLEEYIFKQVCRDLRTWIDKVGIENVKPVSVNLSRLHLYNRDLVSEYCDIQRTYQIPSYLLPLELTETALFDNETAMIGIIDEFHKRGFSIQMDDFGSGYSSLNMLKNIPIDAIKLDKGFIDDLSFNPRGSLVIESVVRLAQSLNMKVIAEGVETKEQFIFLQQICCDEIQGFYFAKPMEKSLYEQRLYLAIEDYV